MPAIRYTIVCTMAMWFLVPKAWGENLLGAYRETLQTSPVLAQAQATLRAAMQGRPIAESAFLPQLGVSASVGYNTGTFTGFAGLDLNRGYLSNSYSVTLSQSVFNGQAQMALREAGSRIQAQAAVVADTEQQLALEVARSYFGVLQAQAQLAVAKKQKKLLDSIYRQTASALQIGTGDIVAVREAKARRDAADADLVKARNALAVARRGLQRLTHHPVGVLASLKNYQALGPQPDRMRAWVQTAIKDQPQILRAEAELRTSREEVQYRQRARWPRLDLQGIAQHQHGNPFPGFNENQAGVSLNLSMPLYEGGRIYGSVQKAEAQNVASLDHVESIRDSIVLNTQTAFLNLKSSVAELRAARAAVDSAKISLDGTRKGYEVGTRSIIDLLQTATDYIRAEQDYNVAFYSQIVSRVALKAAAGQLDFMDLQAINALLDRTAT